MDNNMLMENTEFKQVFIQPIGMTGKSLALKRSYSLKIAILNQNIQ